MGVELKIEPWGEVENEVQALLREHLLELNGTEMKLDLGLCRAMDAAGVLIVSVGRIDGELVGYCMWTLGPSLEHAGEIYAEQKPWYVARPHRNSSLAIRLLKFSLDDLRSRGIRKCFPHHWGNETLGKLFSRLGARPVEWVFEMELC